MIPRRSFQHACLLALAFGVIVLALLPRVSAGQEESASLSPSPVERQRSQAASARIELVGQLPLSGGIHADVWAHRDVAYVGTWTGGCPGTGVKMIDISDPAQPAFIGTLAAHAGTSAEDMLAIQASTPFFEGDLLIVGLQNCGQGGTPGAEFWDVSDPHTPRRLGFFATPRTGGVHELYMFQRGDRVFALLAVPHSEANGAGGDLRIVEATDPSHPVQLADWGLSSALGLSRELATGQFPDVFAHSAISSADGRLAYVPYWDAGLVILDIEDPSQPRFLGRTQYAATDEGNAHSSAVTADGRLLVVADEDIHVSATAVRVDAPASLAGAVQAVEATFTRPLARTDLVNAEVAYVGRGCPAGTGFGAGSAADPLLAEPRGKIALIDRGECLFAEKIARAETEGALAVIVVNNEDRGAVQMGGSSVVSRIEVPAVMISRSDGERIKRELVRGSVFISIGRGVGTRFNDWGFLRFYDVRDPASPIQVASFATSNARTDPVAGPPDDGHYSVHNPVIMGQRLYATWFSDGLRVLDISEPTAPRELAAFVPPAHPDPTGAGLNPNRPMVWGLHVYKDLVLLSDMNYGLYVVRLVESAA